MNGELRGRVRNILFLKIFIISENYYSSKISKKFYSLGNNIKQCMQILIGEKLYEIHKETTIMLWEKYKKGEQSVKGIETDITRIRKKQRVKYKKCHANRSIGNVSKIDS